jgi:hypothetical protein
VPEKDAISPQLAAEILAQLGHVRGMQEQEGRQLAAIAAKLEAQDANDDRREREFMELAAKVGEHNDWIQQAKGKGALLNALLGLAGGGLGAAALELFKGHK